MFLFSSFRKSVFPCCNIYTYVQTTTARASIVTLLTTTIRHTATLSQRRWWVSGRCTVAEKSCPTTLEIPLLQERKYNQIATVFLPFSLLTRSRLSTLQKRIFYREGKQCSNHHLLGNLHTQGAIVPFHHHHESQLPGSYSVLLASAPSGASAAASRSLL